MSFWMQSFPQATIKPTKPLQLPANFLEAHYDVDAIMSDGLRVVIEADGCLDTETVVTMVAPVQPHQGGWHWLVDGICVAAFNFMPTCATTISATLRIFTYTMY